jgi:hypothetical protein
MRRKRSLGLTSSSPNKLPIQEDIKEEFEVEQILAHRFEESGQRSYKIKWLGYPDEENTWFSRGDAKSSRGGLSSLLPYYKSQRNKQAQLKKYESLQAHSNK